MGYSPGNTSRNLLFLMLVSCIILPSSTLGCAAVTNVTTNSGTTPMSARDFDNAHECNDTNSVLAKTPLSTRLNKNVIQEENHSATCVEFNTQLPIIHITRGFFGDSITVAHLRGNNPVGIPVQVVLSEWSTMIGPNNAPVISSCEPNSTLFNPTLCTKEECPWFTRGKYTNGIDGSRFSNSQGMLGRNFQRRNYQSKIYDFGMMRLHMEIEDFFTYTRPTPEELNARLEVFERVKKFVKGIWPNNHVELFGSVRTGLFLPTSDVDVIIYGEWETLPFKFLADAAIETNLTEINKVLIIETATVPIVRIRDKISGIGVDFAFNNYKDPVGVQLITIFSKRYPKLAKILFILKKLLVNLNLNSAALKGGMSSFQLIQMIIPILQSQPPLHGNRPPHLGRLLLKFCNFFGREYNYLKSTSNASDCGIYVPTPQDYRNGFAFLLARIDAGLRPVNAIGSGVARGSSITSAIDLAFQKLQRGLEANAADYDYSILASIFSITRDELNFDRNRPECHLQKKKGRTLDLIPVI